MNGGFISYSIYAKDDACPNGFVVKKLTLNSKLMSTTETIVGTAARLEDARAFVPNQLGYFLPVNAEMCEGNPVEVWCGRGFTESEESAEPKSS